MWDTQISSQSKSKHSNQSIRFVLLAQFLAPPLGGALRPPHSLLLLSLLLIPLIYFLTTFPLSLKANNNNTAAVYTQTACWEITQSMCSNILWLKVNKFCRLTPSISSVLVLLQVWGNTGGSLQRGQRSQLTAGCRFWFFCSEQCSVCCYNKTWKYE